MLLDKAFNIAKIYDLMNIKVDLLQWSIHFLIKKTPGGATTLAHLETFATLSKSAIKNENISSKGLAEQLHKPIIRKFNKRKVCSPFIDNIWGADFADMQLISNLIKDLDFCYVLLTFIGNMHGLFLYKIKKEL